MATAGVTLGGTVTFTFTFTGARLPVPGGGGGIGTITFGLGDVSGTSPGPGVLFCGIAAGLSVPQPSPSTVNPASAAHALDAAATEALLDGYGGVDAALRSRIAALAWIFECLWYGWNAAAELAGLAADPAEQSRLAARLAH